MSDASAERPVSSFYHSVRQAVRQSLSDARGSAAAAGLFATVILMLLAAALVDVYRIQDIRTFAYGAANDAALAGVSLGRDWNAYTATGELPLDSSAAQTTARDTLVAQMARRGLTAYTYQIEALPNAEGNAPRMNFPRVARATWFCSAEPCAWTEAHPAVGVYVEVTVPTILFNLVNGNQPIVVHAFAAAEVVAR